MFRTDRSAKVALSVMTLMMALAVVVMLSEKKYDEALMALGILIICAWTFLNPWIMQEKYSITMTLDRGRMQHTWILTAGLVFLGWALLLILFRVTYT